MALFAAGVLLVLPDPGGQPTGATPEPVRRSPAMRVVDAPPPTTLRGNLADGAPYTPLLFLDSDSWVGQARTPDGKRLRLLLSRAGTVRELRSVPVTVQPAFFGVNQATDTLVWAETRTVRERTSGALWRLQLPDGEPVRIAADAGPIVNLESRYDVVVDAGRVWWTARPPGGTRTALRSVALDGGPVETERLDGQWSLAAWPMLADATFEALGSTALRDRTTGERTTVAAQSNEVVDCSARWCRVRVLRTGGILWQDMMRPDGSNRRRIVTGGATIPAVYDVAVLGRYELLATPIRSGGARLVAYDVVKRRQLRLADGAGTTLARGRYVWWSSGGNDSLRWHVLDLTAL